MAINRELSQFGRLVEITDGSHIGIGTTSSVSIGFGTITANQLSVSGVSTFQGNVNLGDDDKIIMGDGSDLQIFHNSSNNNSIIQESGPGNLVISADNNVEIKNTFGTEFKAKFITDGAVELYYDNSKKFETTGAGATVTGDLYATAFYGDGSNLTGISGGGGSTAGIDTTGTSYFNQLSVSGVSTFQGNVNLGDNDRLRLGDNNDLEIYHDSTFSNSIIRESGSGNLLFGGDNILFRNAAITENTAKFITNGAVELYYDNSKKFETTGGGVDVTGHTETDTLRVSGVSTFQGNVFLGDNDKINLGASNDLQIYHDGSNSYIDEQGTGDLILRGASDIKLMHPSSGETYAIFNANGAVELYYDNSKKFETTSTGVSVTGLLSATTKSFVIDHPTKEGMKLRYGSLEGPENGVYVRGRLKDNNTIELPDYWTGLVDEDTITVNLTPIGTSASLHSVVDIVDNTVVVESANGNINCFYTVFGERKDVEKLEVEY